jgi:uncharacterized protein YjbI with pentapeptide repeats
MTDEHTEGGEHPGARDRSPALLAIGLSIIALLLGVVALIAAVRASRSLLPAALIEMGAEQLQEEKLRQEILNLQRQRSPWTWIPVALTVGIPAAGLVVTLWKNVEERKQQRLENQREHEAILRQQRHETMQRFDEQFASIVTNLGSEKPATQASSALSLLAFMKPEYAEYSNQILLVLLANLRVDHPPEVNKMLVWVFERVVRQQFSSGRDEDRELALRLSGARLDRIDLSGLDLTGVDLGFASLRGANLRDTILFRARGIEVVLDKARLSNANLREARLRGAHAEEAHFHDADLVSARLEEATLVKAEFQRAKLQEAHLDGATLKGGRFEEANVNNAYFLGAVFDRPALMSLSKAKSWRQANLDEKVRAALTRYSERGARASRSPGPRKR